jgi:hypothetical protein
MPKRFTDTDKWKKPFVRGLLGAYKLLWLYICDDCDHAGIWQVDIEIAQIKIGEKITEKEAIKQFGKKIQIFDNGTKWFIPSFIEFQYPSGLNPANKAHSSVLNILKNKGLTCPIQGAKDMDMVKDKDIKEGGMGETFVLNWDQDKKNFLQDDQFKMQFTQVKKIPKKDLENLMEKFVADLEMKEEYKPHKEIKRHFTNWFNKNSNGTHQRASSGGSKSAGVDELSGQLEAKLAARGSANIES